MRTKKTPTVWMDVFVLSLGFRLQGVDVELDGALEVRSLVLVHDVVLRELVEHRRNLRKQCLGGALLGGSPHLIHDIAGRLVEQTVVRTLLQRLTNPFLR